MRRSLPLGANIKTRPRLSRWSRFSLCGGIVAAARAERSTRHQDNRNEGGGQLRRPYLGFGAPSRYRDWDLGFISWLKRAGKQVDYLSDDDLQRIGSGDARRRAYSMVVFPGHEEYVTRHAYDVIELPVLG